jgi:hypothetical protein
VVGKMLPRVPFEFALAVLAGAILWLALGLWSNALNYVSPKLTTQTTLGPALDDYGVFHTAARMVAKGEGSDLYNLEVVHEEQAITYGPPPEKNPLLPFYNPPAFAAVLVPLTFLPINVAASLFLLASASALVVAAWLLWRYAHLRGIGTWLWVTAALSFLPLQDTIYHGQLSFFLLFTWTASFFLFAQGRDRLAGGTLGLLLVKPPLLLLPLAILVWKRRWRALQGAAAMVGGAVVLSVLASGPAILWQYPSFLRQAAGWDDINGIAIWFMFGWNALFRASLGAGQQATVSFWAVVLSVPTVLACLAAWRGPWETSSRRFGTRFAALVLAVLLINPHLYRQDLVILLLPAALMLGAAQGQGWRFSLSLYLVVGWLGILYHFVLLNALGVNLTVLNMALFLTLCVVASLPGRIQFPELGRRRRIALAGEVPIQ